MANFLDDDGLVYLWSKIKSKIEGRVPTSRTVNGKALTGNISLSASDVGASSSGHNHDGRYAKGNTSQISRSQNAGTLTLPSMNTGDIVSYKISNNSREDDMSLKTPSGGTYMVLCGAYGDNDYQDPQRTMYPRLLSGNTFFSYLSSSYFAYILIYRVS